MMRLSLFVVAAFALVAGCSDKDATTGPDSGDEGMAILRGVLEVRGEPLSGAVVQIDDFFNWRTQTDSAGAFEIGSVTPGEHTLRASGDLDSGHVVALEGDMLEFRV